MDGEGAEEDRKNKKTPKDKKEKKEKKEKKSKEQDAGDASAAAVAVDLAAAESSPAGGLEVKPKKLKAKKEKKDKKSEKDPTEDLADEAKPASGVDTEKRRASEAPVREEPLAEFLDEEPRDGELLAETMDGPGPSEPRASWVDVDVVEQTAEGEGGPEHGSQPEDEFRVSLPDSAELDPLIRDEPRASHVSSRPPEDFVPGEGPAALQLGGNGDDVNVPERVVDGPRRYSLGGQETVRKCNRCDLIWDIAVTHCSQCGKKLVESTIQVTQLLSASQIEFLEQAFKRYDVDGSGRLDGKELRMAVRELGWDTKQDVLDRWARVGGNQGLNLDMFKNLIASGKLGKKTFKPIVGKASEAVKDDRRQLLAMGGAAPQFTQRQRQGRRGALIPGQDQAGPNLELDGGPTSTAPPFGEGVTVFEELAAHRKMELTEAWAFWDADHSGFLEPIELMNASKGLGFHIPIESVVAVCGKHGGGIDQENFIRVMSVQIKHRDEELGLSNASNLNTLGEDEDDDAEDSTSFRAKRKKELAKAELNLRRTSVTDKNFRWRNLLCTSHSTVGEHAIGVRLYFDLLLLLVIAFGVLTGTTLPFLVMCANSSGGGPVLKQTDDVLSTLAKYSVGNLDRAPAAEATVHIMNEFVGSMALLGVLLLYRFVIIHRATYSANSRNMANLAIQVRGLPTDLGYHHLGYEELLREHFQTVAYEQALRMGTAHELDDQPVREVVLWRNYDAAVAGVLRQVELQAKQFTVNTELKFLEQKAREHNLSDELEHDLGYNAGGGLAPTSGRRQSTKGRMTMKVMADRASGGAGSVGGGQEDGANFSHAVTTSAERMYDRMCNRADGGKRLAKRQNYLLSMNDLIEEQILEIETERALHSDLKPDEREVMGAFVVFWCQRTRDAVLGQYGWSRSWCCRACCQRRRLRLKLPFEEESDGSEGAPDEEEIAFPLIVEPTQDPSLQLWQNMDVKPLMRVARGCAMSICRILVLQLICIAAIATVSTHIYYPLLLPIDAKVWLLTNVSQPVANNSDEAAACWRVCELELFGDELCSDRKAPYMWVSSNGLPMRHDAGLQAVGDRNLAGGSMCINDWRASNCWESINLESMTRQCHEEAGCPASRRLETETPSDELFIDEEPISEPASWLPSASSSRKLSAVCPWVTAGTYNFSLITYTIRYQTKGWSLGGTIATKSLLKAALASALGMNPTVLSDVSSIRQPHVFFVNPPPPGNSTGPVPQPTCADTPDAAKQLLQWLGLSGPATRGLASCKDFAHMGLLGVPFCSNVPKEYRCLCAQTCGCPCARPDVCDCEDPPFGVDLLPLPEPGEVVTWETEIRVCSQDGHQLMILTCGFEDIFDTTQANPSLAAVATTWLQSQRENGILPITVLLGTPLDNGCNSAPHCQPGSVRCYSRFNEEVCAKRCDGIEECFNATDELNCRPCGSVAGSFPQSTCTLPVGRCADPITGASACTECSLTPSASSSSTSATSTSTSATSTSSIRTSTTSRSTTSTSSTSTSSTSSFATSTSSSSTSTSSSSTSSSSTSTSSTSATSTSSTSASSTSISSTSRSSTTTATTSSSVRSGSSTPPTLLDLNQTQLCGLLNIPAGATTEGAKQCNASFCEVLQRGTECDPGSPNYDPCRCLEARQLPEERAAFGCLLRGNFSAAVRSTFGALSFYHFDAIRAKVVDDWLGDNHLECYNTEGSSGGCAVTSADRIEGPALILTGPDWLQSADEVAAPTSHAMHMWVSSTCTSCAIAGLLGGGTLFVDATGYLAAKSPTGTSLEPASGPLLNDGNFHFVAFSLGATNGELLVADGTVLSQRTYEAASTAGWSSPVPVKVMIGNSSTDSVLANFKGEIDVAGVFTNELSSKVLRHHMLAASWRGPGLTFAERYLTAACEDSRLANSTYPPCGEEAEIVLSRMQPCVQGDFCGCHSRLKGDPALLCALGCPGTARLRRSLAQILQEKCSDKLQLGKSCQSNSDCDLLFPPIGQDSKLVCDIDTWKCKLDSSLVQAQHVLRGTVCIARSRNAKPLGRWQAQYLLASLAKTNSSLFLSVELQDGCVLSDANISGNLISAHDGSSSYLKQEVNFQTTVTHTVTSTTSTTYPNSTDSGTSEDETSDPVLPPAENTTTTTTLIFPGKMQVRVPPGLVFGAGGVQTLTITANATTDLTAMEELETAAGRLQSSLGSVVSQETIPDVTWTDMATEVPDLESFIYSRADPAGGSLLSNVTYAIMGTALTSVTYEEPELCTSAEFECSPGVCVLCPGGQCQCDGWKDCENGADEDLWGVLLQRNVTTAACVQLRTTASQDLSVNGNGTVEGGDPCFGLLGFPCNSTVCVPIPQECDDVPDCPAGDDEQGCPSLPESDESNASESATWVAAVFFDSTEIKCAKLAQPDGVVTPEVQLMACSLEAVIPPVLDVAKANGSNVPSPLRKPSANCLYMATIKTDSTPIDLLHPTFVRTEVDHASGQVTFAEKRCAVGPNLKNHEIIGLATAELAYNADNTSKIVKCYCMQRMYLEPDVFLALGETEKRAVMCAEYISISQGNYHRSWIRVGMIVLFNELFEALIRGTSTSVRYKDETTRLVRHFRNLFWFWLLNSALIPAVVSCTIPAFWGWLNRVLEIGGTDVGGMSMREWHGWVGCVITLVMGLRVVIPQVPDVLAIACRRCGRWRKAQKTISQEDLKNLYMNPEFRLAEGFAEIAVTASLAMIFGPALPLLNVLAAASCFTRYLVDWYVFLRHARRPPMYDETIARVCVDQLLLSLVFRSATSILVWVDPMLFVSDVAGCSVSEDDVDALRAQYFLENFRMFELFVNPTCNPTAWFFGFLPGLSAVGCLIILPNLAILRSIFLVLCRRCRSKTGYLYDDVVQARMQRKLVPSYQPRVHPAYQSAFKLMDLTANFNEQGLSDSSESRASTDLASEEGEQEDNLLAATIFGKEYGSMEHFKREKAEKKAKKKEKEKSGDGEKKHKKKRKSKSTDPFMDDEVNPYDAGASDKHKKKKKKDKDGKKDQAQFSEAKELAGIIDF